MKTALYVNDLMANINYLSVFDKSITSSEKRIEYYNGLLGVCEEQINGLNLQIEATKNDKSLTESYVAYLVSELENRLSAQEVEKQKNLSGISYCKKTIAVEKEKKRQFMFRSVENPVIKIADFNIRASRGRINFSSDSTDMRAILKFYLDTVEQDYVYRFSKENLTRLNFFETLLYVYPISAQTLPDCVLKLNTDIKMLLVSATLNGFKNAELMGRQSQKCTKEDKREIIKHILSNPQMAYQLKEEDMENLLNKNI